MKQTKLVLERRTSLVTEALNIIKHLTGASTVPCGSKFFRVGDTMTDDEVDRLFREVPKSWTITITDSAHNR